MGEGGVILELLLGTAAVFMVMIRERTGPLTKTLLVDTLERELGEEEGEQSTLEFGVLSDPPRSRRKAHRRL